MGSKKLSKSDRSKELSPTLRKRVEESRKRFQCDVLGFWRRCRLRKCQQRYRCLGDPHDCFARHHAAMPDDHRNSRVATLMSKAVGIGTVEQQLRAAGASVQGRLRRAPPPRRAPPAAPKESEASLQARRRAEILARVAPRGIASLKKELKEAGMTLQAIVPKPADRAAPPVGPDQEREARWQALRETCEESHRYMERLDKVAPRGVGSLESDLNELGLTTAVTYDSKPGMTILSRSDRRPVGVPLGSVDERGMIPEVDEHGVVEWEPMKGSSIDPIRMAGRLPPPPDSDSTPATPASPTQADAADPPPPTRPPGVEPWQAWCDEQGRLHMPDPAVVDEHFRLPTAAEIYERMLSYRSSS